MFFGDDSESDQSGSVSDCTMLSLVAFTSLTSLAHMCALLYLRLTSVH